MDTISKKIEVDVSYFIGRQDPQRGIFEGGVPDPPYLDELILDLSIDEVYDEAADDFVPSGRTQVNVRGTRRSYAAFARFLLALCELRSADPDYHSHLEDVRNAAGESAVHMIVHAPIDP